MKKQVLAGALAASIAAVAIAGASLAYFTDTDNADNTFTVGNVAINLDENFDQGSKLLPGSKDKNNVQKEVWVENTGSEEAYVRVHIAIPSLLDDAQPDFDASKNVLHFNNSNMGIGKWNWSKSLDGNDDTGASYVKDPSQWNTYTTKIDGIDYNVYVVTYESVLAPGEKTPTAMDQVYLDAKTSNEDITTINNVLGEEWQIKVFAEGVQAEGFTDAYAAFAAAFDDDGLSNPWANA